MNINREPIAPAPGTFPPYGTTLLGRLVQSPFRCALVLHFLFALVIFSPFFTEGKMLVASTDNYYYIFPNLIFGHRYIHDLNFFPWNPLLLAGVDFSSSNYNFMYSPFNWILYLFPERFFFIVLTVQNFIAVWLTGVFAFLFMKEEIKDNKWALFGSTTYQLCGHLLFSLNMYPYFIGYFLSIVAAYLIWTSYKRKPYHTFIALTIVLSTIMLSCHILRAFMIMLMIVILYIYREWPKSIHPIRIFKSPPVFYLSILTSLLLSMIRLWPLVHDAGGSDRLFTGTFGKLMSLYSTSSYYALNAFVPEAFGIRVFDGTSLPGAPGPPYAFSLTYLGVIPALLAAYAIIRKGYKPIFWVIFFIAALLYQLEMRPFADLLQFLLFPAAHAFLLKILTPLPFCVLATFGGKYLTDDVVHGIRFRWLYVLITAVVLFLITLIGQKFSILPQMKIVLVLVAVLLALAVPAYKKSPESFRLISAAIPWISLFLSLFFIIGIGNFSIDLISMTAIRYVCFSILMISIFWIGIRYGSKFFLVPGKEWRAPIIFTAPALLILFLIPFGELNLFPDPIGNVSAMIAGIWRFLLLVLFFVFVVSWFKRQRISPRAFVIVLLLVVPLDLLPYGKMYVNNVCMGFWEQDNLQYPERLNKRFEREILRNHDNPQGKNLLINGGFENWANNVPEGWKANIPTLISDGDLKLSGEKGLKAHSDLPDDQGVVYQDVFLDLPVATSVSFGVWVKAYKPDTVRIYFTDRKRGVFSKFHSGSGKWEWLTASFQTAENENPIRLRTHVFVSYHEEFYADDAIMVLGGYVNPYYGYSKDAIPKKMLNRHEFEEKPVKPLDIKHYRIPQPSAFMKIGAKYTYTHIPYLYGIPSFGGVNGFRSPYFLKLNEGFVGPDDKRPGNGGQFEYLNSQRFLDLVGCGYDLDEKGNIFERENALSRFMLFHDAEIIADDDKKLKRLKEEEFNPRQTLTLNADPGIDFKLYSSEATDLDFQVENDNHIKLRIDSPAPAVVLFNDSYDDGWRAQVNGIETQIMRANLNFMAFTVPKGKSEINLQFKPADYRIRLGSVISGFILLLFISCGLFLNERRARIKNLPADITTTQED